MPEPSHTSPDTSPARVQLRLSPLLWSVLGLSLLWTAMASMDWWGAPHEQQWITALTLQSLSQGDGWTVNGLDIALATPSPLMPILGMGVSALFPAAPMALWALGIIGVGLFAFAILSMRWADSLPAEWAIGVWTVVVWGTHPLVLSSLGEGWLLALGVLILGVALIESGRDVLGWLLIGVSVVGRAEMTFGLIAVALWWFARGRRAQSWKCLAALVVPVAWCIFALVTFGHVLPTSWPVAEAMSRTVDSPHHLFKVIADQSPVWAICLGVLILTSFLAIRSWGAFAWVGFAVGVGCAAVHLALGLPTDKWWWFNLGPLFGAVILAATGLSWFLSTRRPLPVRAAAAIVAFVILISQWLSFPGPAEIETRREENQSWQLVGRWVRENATPHDHIATTCPGSLTWHTGVVQRLAVRQIAGLIGPLASDLSLLDAINEGGDNTQAIIDALNQVKPTPDLLILRHDADAKLILAVESSGDWEHRDTVAWQGGLAVEVFARRQAESRP